MKHFQQSKTVHASLLCCFLCFCTRECNNTDRPLHCSISEGVLPLQVHVSRACHLQITAQMQTPPMGCLTEHHTAMSIWGKAVHLSVLLRNTQTFSITNVEVKFNCVQTYGNSSIRRQIHKPSHTGACGNRDRKKRWGLFQMMHKTHKKWMLYVSHIVSGIVYYLSEQIFTKSQGRILLHFSNSMSTEW